MEPPDGLDCSGVLEMAATHAVMDARWEAAELLSRRSGSAAADLLRARAAELGSSPIGRDQVLSMALEVAADDVQHGRPALEKGALFFFEEPVDSEARGRTQREVFAKFCATASSAADGVTRRLEAEYRHELAGTRAIAELAVRLLNDARLHKQLWDDPRIPADTDTRLLILCSVPRLVDRARAVDPMHLRALRSLAKRPRERMAVLK